MTRRNGIIVQRERIFFTPLQKISWVQHCFTTRQFMEKDMGRIGMCGELKRRYFPSARAVVWGEQVHGRGVATIDGAAEMFSEIPRADALVCAKTGICLVAFAADCPIVYIADVEKKVIALVHSGREGSEKRVVTACVEKMAREFGTAPADCVVVISPSIGPCSYPVDLWRSIEEECCAVGIGSLMNAKMCTACQPDLFFSYRRERDRCGRMLAAMMITTAENLKMKA